MPDFAVGSPTDIAITGFPQIHLRDLLKASGRVESRGNLVGNPLIVDESASMSGANGLLIQLLGVDPTPFDPGDFGSDENRTVFKILRAMLRPYFELSVVSY